MSIKVAQSDFTRKMIDFDTFRYKNCLKLQENWANSLFPKALKLAESAKYRPIWSHWLGR